MKQAVVTAEALLLLLFLLPVLCFGLGSPGEAAPPPATLPPRPTAAQSAAGDASVTVRVQADGQVISLSMEDYLWRVVAAEMPASFELEALKAQAVAARTYTCYKMGHPSPNHPDADVCDDITCCKAYITPEEAAANWGDSAQLYADKIARAVAETDALAVLYDGQPIQAVFHSSSAGHTQDAQAVWGNAVPYLVSVDSPEGDEVPSYQSQVTVSAQQFRDVFLARYPDADLSGAPPDWFDDLTDQPSVRTVGGVEVPNTVLRSLFSLRSATFSIQPEEEQLTFSVTGYGHGVGMSQYGANKLAQEGMSFEEILKWYYTGVTVEPYQP